MPLLGTLIVNLITGLATFLVKFVSQKIAVASAISVILAALMLTIFVALRSALAAATIAAGGLHPMFGAGISMIISPRVAALLASWITFWMLIEVYKWKLNLVQLWARTI
jgi:hypothetical protein